MVKYTLRTTGYTGGRAGSYKASTARKLVAKAGQLLRARNASSLRAPLRTGGFYGTYNRRGRDELKFIDSNVDGASPAVGAVFLINGIVQGTDYNQRIGRKVMLKSIFVRFTINAVPANLALQGDVVRLMIFYDSQANGAAPAITDVLAIAEYDSPMNLNNRDRFKVLHDKFYTMWANTYAAGIGGILTGNAIPKFSQKYIKCNMEEIFGGTGATIGSIQTGSLWFLTISQNEVSGVSLYSRVRYTDS